MFLDKTVAVVIPCYNEETQIGAVLDGLPPFVDRVIVVDDASPDGTSRVVSAYAARSARVELLRLEKNAGVGGAIGRGYQRVLELGLDIAVVVGGDGQMDPADLPAVIAPVAKGYADYCKGNRFFYLEGQGIRKIPRLRLVGNFILSTLTKIVSGYWHVSDTQCGYTAVNRRALKSIDVTSIYPRYGCPNDILTKLNVAHMRVAEVAVNPLYGVGEVSKMKIPRVVLPILCLMARLFFQRMLQKYIYRTGHPLVLAYALSLLLLGISLALVGYIFVFMLTHGYVHKAALITSGIGAVLSLQLALSAFEMDFNFNQELNIDLNHLPPADDAQTSFPAPGPR